LNEVVPDNLVLASLWGLENQGDGVVKLPVPCKLDHFFREQIGILGQGDLLVQRLLFDRSRGSQRGLGEVSAGRDGGQPQLTQTEAEGERGHEGEWGEE